MNCKQASKMMSMRLDERLDSTENALLDTHMNGCSACQTEWHGLQSLDSLLFSASMMQPPVRVRVQVMTRLNRREQARRAIIGGTTLTLGTVALALLALAPVILGLLNATGIAPALIAGGPETVAQLVTFLSTIGRALLVLMKKFAFPLTSIGMCCLMSALALNSWWVSAVRRSRITS
ncbi:MAG: zf-HC2 domain-containing protein [Chloroflexi bacterium]|nr:zf-HC2 domain-containing protein [Chloroflexota bacterium]